MWSLGKVIDTPEVSRVYVGTLLAIHPFLMPFFLELRVQAFCSVQVLLLCLYVFDRGSFWDQPLKNEKLRELFEQEDGWVHLQVCHAAIYLGPPAHPSIL